jgi:hypothetical protein
VAHAGLVAGAGEVVDREAGREIDERARDRGDGNAAPGRGVAWVDATGSAGSDAVDPSLGRGRDLGRRRRALEEPEQLTGRPPAQERSLAARVDGGEVTGLDARGRVADAIDAAVLSHERPRAKARIDLIRGHARAQQLRPGHHPVRRRRKPPENLLHCPALTGHQPV